MAGRHLTMAWSRMRDKSKVTNQAKVGNKQAMKYQIRSWIKVRNKAEVRNRQNRSTKQDPNRVRRKPS